MSGLCADTTQGADTKALPKKKWLHKILTGENSGKHAGRKGETTRRQTKLDVERDTRDKRNR